MNQHKIIKDILTTPPNTSLIYPHTILTNCFTSYHLPRLSIDSLIKVSALSQSLHPYTPWSGCVGLEGVKKRGYKGGIGRTRHIPTFYYSRARKSRSAHVPLLRYASLQAQGLRSMCLAVRHGTVSSTIHLSRLHFTASESGRSSQEVSVK